MLFSVIPLGFAVIGVLALINPMMFWTLEKQKPAWCRRHDEPDNGWITETRVFGGFAVVIGLLGTIFELKQLIYWLF